MNQIQPKLIYWKDLIKLFTCGREEQMLCLTSSNKYFVANGVGLIRHYKNSNFQNNAPEGCFYVDDIVRKEVIPLDELKAIYLLEE